MKVACPTCATKLSVPDDRAGKRVRCSSCQQVFEVPAATAATAVVAAPTASKPPPIPSVIPVEPETGLQREAPAPVPSRSCPECGEPLGKRADKCPQCGWNAEEEPRSRRDRRPRKDDRGFCYLRIGRDEVGVTEGVEKRLEKLIETEQLNLLLVDDDLPEPDEMGPNDLVIDGRVNVANYGSQFVRYFLTFIAIIGPGSCQLDVEAEIETAEGKPRRVNAKARQAVGIFGGTGTGLMKINVRVVSNKIATEAARHATGKWFLNAHAYLCAYWALGLGLASFIPFLGIGLGPAGFICGMIGLTTIVRRDLPRGKLPAVIGILCSLMGTLIGVGCVVLAILADRR